MKGLLVRGVGALLLGAGGFWMGRVVAAEKTSPTELALSLALLVAGAVLAAGIFPIIFFRPAERARRRLRRLSLFQIGLGGVGLTGGLIVSALLVPVLSRLPEPADWIAPLVTAIVAGGTGTLLMAGRTGELTALFGHRYDPPGNGLPGKSWRNGQKFVVDTSAIIDGRIADISEAGFIQGSLVLPRFVLDELRHIADSPDALRRNRGRRGLDILNRLQKESPVPIEITDSDFEDIQEVDSKLVKMASLLGCPIITNDFNLNRVAELEGVRVLNINQLANAVKSVVLPGEEMAIRVIQEGKEAGQGVGFLDDGTMVVVEGGRRHLNDEIEISVTRVLQTVAGRMIFAQPKGNG
ncbi:MAG TPA: PIN domain-containing protein [Dehalococcoidia bacterium]|nr:PIN domain-containing protein [Dehalococcoidia bacterium]